jgi:hypothetical protein
MTTSPHQGQLPVELPFPFVGDFMRAWAAVVVLAMVGCAGPAGPQGPPGPAGASYDGGLGARVEEPFWVDAADAVIGPAVSDTTVYWFDSDGNRFHILGNGTFSPKRAVLYFASSDCSGASLVGLSDEATDPAPARLVFAVPGGEYVVRRDAGEPQSLTGGSYLDPAGTVCTAFGTTTAVFDRSALEVVTSTPPGFKTPFRIELR